MSDWIILWWTAGTVLLGAILYMMSEMQRLRELTIPQRAAIKAIRDIEAARLEAMAYIKVMTRGKR